MTPSQRYARLIEWMWCLIYGDDDQGYRKLWFPFGLMAIGGAAALAILCGCVTDAPLVNSADDSPSVMQFATVGGIVLGLVFAFGVWMGKD